MADDNTLRQGLFQVGGRVAIYHLREWRRVGMRVCRPRYKPVASAAMGLRERPPATAGSCPACPVETAKAGAIETAIRMPLYLFNTMALSWRPRFGSPFDTLRR